MRYLIELGFNITTFAKFCNLYSALIVEFELSDCSVPRIVCLIQWFGYDELSGIA